MRLNWMVPMLSLPLAACTGLPWLRQVSQEEAAAAGAVTDTEPVQARVELQDIHFDGQALYGRLLISTKEQALRLDRRLIESIALITESVTECDTGRPLAFIEVDVLSPRLREQDILVLKPSYWYGKQISVPLFTGSLNAKQGEPACIDAEFTFYALGGRAAARLKVQAVREPQSSPSTGTPAQ